MCCFFVSLLSLFFPCSPLPRSSILSRTGRKESQEASNLAVPMTMCLFPVPFPLTPSLRPQVSSINPTVTRSLLYSVLRDAPADRGGAAQQSRDAQLSEYPSLDYQGLYATLVTLLDLVPLLQHGQHGEWYVVRVLNILTIQKNKKQLWAKFLHFWYTCLNICNRSKLYYILINKCEKSLCFRVTQLKNHWSDSYHFLNLIYTLNMHFKSVWLLTVY